MVGAVVIILAFVLMVLLSIKHIRDFIDEKERYEEKIDKYKSIKEELEEENNNLRDLRRMEIRNNTQEKEKNAELLKLLNEIADRAVQCPVGSEKIVLNKIRELTHKHQTN